MPMSERVGECLLSIRVAFDDAVVAYSKAIELDRWFAWPYSNLALTYVQKGALWKRILALSAQHRNCSER